MNPRLTADEIADITGIPNPDGRRYIAQRNRLQKMGIKAEVNAKHEVVCLWSWVHAAGLPEALLKSYILPPDDESDDDLSFNMAALG